MELLLPMAAKKLDLSFNIEPEVPACKLTPPSFYLLLLFMYYTGVKADYARIRQGTAAIVILTFFTYSDDGCSVDESYWERR